MTTTMPTNEKRVGMIKRPSLRLHDIPGHEIQKRAIEVALTGEHTIVLLYSKGSQAADLIPIICRIANENEWHSHSMAYPVCRCGCYGLPHEECNCRPSAIEKHLAKLGKRISEFDIFIESPSNIVPNFDSEQEEAFVSRIRRNRKDRESRFQSIVIGTDAEELLRVYVREYHAPQTQKTRKAILSIAKTIALMGGSERILAQHVLEAIQYQPQSIPAIRDWIKPQAVEGAA